MPTPDDLLGLGMDSFMATLLGNAPAAITGAGTSQGAATAIKSHLTEIVAAGSATGVIIPSNAHIGTPFWFFTSSSTSGVAYVPSGHTLNGSLNAGLTIAQNKLAILIQYKSKFWGSILTA